MFDGGSFGTHFYNTAAKQSLTYFAVEVCRHFRLATWHEPNDRRCGYPMREVIILLGLIVVGVVLYGAFPPMCAAAAGSAGPAPEVISRVPQELLPASIAPPLLSRAAAAEQPEPGLMANGWGRLLLESTVAGISNLVPTHRVRPCRESFPGGTFGSCRDE